MADKFLEAKRAVFPYEKLNIELELKAGRSGGPALDTISCGRRRHALPRRRRQERRKPSR